MKALLFIFLFGTCGAYGQGLNLKNNRGGLVSLGVRTTYSAFNDHEDESNGMGLGGQFRIQFADRVNSDWFFDYLRSDIGTYASRTDYHIGWSVLFYPLKNPTPLFQPYILAGHCFDYTQLMDNRNHSNQMERWSSAVQGGVGVHVNLSPRLDVSVVGQYMLHLGNDIGAHFENNVVEFHSESGTSMEGHMLFNIGINYKIADLW